MTESSYEKARRLVNEQTSAPESARLFKHSPDGSVQLPLFASARELLSHKPTLGDAIQDESTPHVLGIKYRETSPAFHKSIARHGVVQSIKLGFDAPKPGESSPSMTVWNGHHRLAAMAVDHPDTFIPLTRTNQSTAWWEKDSPDLPISSDVPTRSSGKPSNLPKRPSNLPPMPGKPGA